MTRDQLEITADPGEPTIVTRRRVSAPRALVWDAYTKPEHIRRWLGPRDLELVTCENDLRAGGGWRFVHRAKDGTEYVFYGKYLEVAPVERIRRTFVFEPQAEHEAVETLLLEEQDGGTLITTITAHKTFAARDGHLQAGMRAGMEEGYARLEALLAALGGPTAG